MSKLRITITGEFQKENGDEISQEEFDSFTDDFLEFIEKKEICFIGVTDLEK